ncbi:amino acid ABC transporter ATP-binding protein [Salipiger marinus]|uniref:Amino acid ABC transporter ATP-binding protein, PAAT family n=1 Tax=Salipiger marinus TaxID=555512 RepID=A0A1G8UHS5_9RHOB|nr:amino acid ABC transporter ATP-binding protein [Salipiger marinus]SDJ53289.1 amino acid ABC transporter ATP-binding protein, PAAT family [Salipiger marinus]
MPLLEVRDLHKSYGALDVLKGIDLTVDPGEIVGFIGASGSGKSTLLRCMNHMEVPTKGIVMLEGEIVGVTHKGDRLVPRPARDLSQQRRKMAMVFQHFNLWPHKTTLENVMEGPVTVQKIPKAEARDRALAALKRVGLKEKADTYPSRLSGGQQQRVGIARALALQPQVILFDEPTSALDPELVNEVLNVIRSLGEDGITLVIVTHEMRFAREVCDKVIFLDEGRVADMGSPDHIFGTTENPRTRAFVQNYFG